MHSEDHYMTLSASLSRRRATSLACRSLAPAHRATSRWHFSQRQLLIAAFSTIVALALLSTTVGYQPIASFDSALQTVDAAAELNPILLQSFVWILPVLHAALTP